LNLRYENRTLYAKVWYSNGQRQCPQWRISLLSESILSWVTVSFSREAGLILFLPSAANDDPVRLSHRSLSFVLATSCLAFYLLAICYLLTDVKGWWSGAPFFYPGQYSYFP
jgi:hypothetical protein